MPQPVYQTAISALLRRSGLGQAPDTLAPLSGDGSDRPFFRLTLGGRSWLAAFPSPTLAKAREEARAVLRIGRHLWAVGVPVPEIVAHDPESGLILFEDLGNRLLFHAVREEGWSEGVRRHYRQALAILAHMQLTARAGFDPQWCWDTGRYDKELMLSRESHYFAQAFCRGYLGLDALPHDLEDDFLSLAERVGQCPASYLLHRDYQSRNLMLVGDEVRVIDFQGARLGPLAYDLAALLNDPYVAMPAACKEEMLGHYLQEAGRYLALDADRFLDEYHHVALQRNLQVLGAYGFLVREKGKDFFGHYIGPALRALAGLLHGPLRGHYPALGRLLAGEAFAPLLLGDAEDGAVFRSLA